MDAQGCWTLRTQGGRNEDGVRKNGDGMVTERSRNKNTTTKTLTSLYAFKIDVMK